MGHTQRFPTSGLALARHVMVAASAVTLPPKALAVSEVGMHVRMWCASASFSAVLRLRKKCGRCEHTNIMHKQGGLREWAKCRQKTKR